MEPFFSKTALKRAAFATVLIPSFLVAADLPSTASTKDAGVKPKVVNINRASLNEDSKKSLGTVRIEEKAKGVVLTPNLEGLKPGLHGFHVHENGDCSSTREKQNSGATPEEVAAGAAGGHLNPGITGGHTGPYGEGHLGDLPNLYVDEDGVADHPVYAPRLRLRDFSDRALVIHASADNYSDEPEENGGSGGRVACGVVD